MAGSHTLKFHGCKMVKKHKNDWIIVVVLESHRNTIPVWAVPIFAVILPIGIFFAFYFKRKDVYDLHHSILGLLYSVLITLVITDLIKDAFGHPRPNFFWRCFPNGIGVYDPKNGNVMCTGDRAIIKGYKSFPSGHSSGLGFLSWYFTGKIKAFDRRGHSAKLCIVLFPLLCCSGGNLMGG